MLRAIAKTVLLFASLFPAKAMSQDEVEAFYKGKVITITSAGGVGGGYGLYAMMLSENLSKHLPGHPKINVNYNPNASGLAAADYIYNVAPKDGTAILAPLSSMTTLQVLGAPGVRFDASKFHWIGRAAETKSLFLAKVGAARDGSTVQTVVGVSHIGAPNYILPAALKFCPGLDLKIVSGYTSSAPLALALERGEIDAVALPLDTVQTAYPNLLKEKLIAQSGLLRSPSLPEVPLVSELCQNSTRKPIIDFFQVQEEVGRSFALPPGTPPVRVEALRKAVAATTSDPDLIAIAKARNLDITPMSGEKIEELIKFHVATEKNFVAQAKQAIGID
ncbi:MAG: hypothetical protein WCN98_19415, partial [Verrucomicrobiaceae bacterium]